MNTVAIMGRICNDVELRSTNSGKLVATFTVAVSDRKDETYFIDCVAWEKTADMLRAYWHKGDMIALTGRIQTRSWEAKDGTKRKAVEVVADRVFFCGAKKDAKPADVYPTEPAFDVFNISDDDLPF